MTIHYSDIMEAHKRISRYLAQTPAYHYPVLDDFIGTQVYVKHENHHTMGAFKIRGGINLIEQLQDAKRRHGLVAASTGNHGQSIAKAGEMVDKPVSIFVPEGTNPNKIAAMLSMGAEVIERGEHLGESLDFARQRAQNSGAYFVDNGNDPMLIAGVGTVAKELIENVPSLDAIFVPVGSGTLAASTCIVAKTLKPAIRVIGVQSERAPAAHDSWQNGKIETRPNQTSIGGLATGTGFELPQSILQTHLDDFMLVSDELILQSQMWLIEKTHTLAEGAGAVGLAAIYAIRESLQGKQVGFICSGGNTSRHELRQALGI